MRKIIKGVSRFLEDIPRRWEVPKDGPSMVNLRRRNIEKSFPDVKYTSPQRALPKFLRRTGRLWD